MLIWESRLEMEPAFISDTTCTTVLKLIGRVFSQGRDRHHIHFANRAKSEMSPDPTQTFLMLPGLLFISAEGRHSPLCLVHLTYVCVCVCVCVCEVKTCSYMSVYVSI